MFFSEPLAVSFQWMNQFVRVARILIFGEQGAQIPKNELLRETTRQFHT